MALCGCDDSKRFDVESYEGSTLFFCNNLRLTGPDFYKFVFSYLGIAIPACAFFAIPVRWLVDNQTGLGWGSAAVALFLLMLSFAGMFGAATTDPGIVARSEVEPDDLYDVNDPIPDRVRTKLVLVNGKPINLKYCGTCKIWRPPRSTHCHVCDNCVDRFDHHCPFIGTCIGRRNYRSFFLFISSTALLCILVILTSGLYQRFRAELFEDVFGLSRSEALGAAFADVEGIITCVLQVYCLLAFSFTGGLTGFHIYLMLSNQTSKESCGNTWGIAGNPYEGNGAKNCCTLICGSKPHSKIRLKYAPDSEEPAYAEPTQLMNGDGEDGAKIPTSSSSLRILAGQMRSESSPNDQPGSGGDLKQHNSEVLLTEIPGDSVAIDIGEADNAEPSVAVNIDDQTAKESGQVALQDRDINATTAEREMSNVSTRVASVLQRSAHLLTANGQELLGSSTEDMAKVDAEE